LLDPRQCEVAILLRPGSNLWRIRDLMPRVQVIEGDLTAPESSADAIRRFAPDTLIHSAWYGVAGIHRNEAEQIHRNLEATASLVQLAARVGCRACVVLGSQAEYGPQNRRLDETAPTEPTTTYGVAKLCSYLLSRHLAKQTGMRLAWVRIFSTYGPGDHPECMIPQLIRALYLRQRPALTAGEQRWDYLYVDDAAEAICRVAECGEGEGVFNLGSGQVETIRRVAEMIRDQIDPSLPLGLGDVPYRPDQVMYLQADIARLKAVTGWGPRTSLEEGLARTVECSQWEEQIA
jgi:nucleoside-diphosphate-sugar epimerase